MLSDGQISRLQRIGRESLQPAYEEITAAVRTSAAVNIDETGWREDGRRAWLWTVVGRFATLFAVRRSRSRAVMRELLGNDFAGVVVADRYSAYAALPDDRRQRMCDEFIPEQQQFVVIQDGLRLLAS